MRTSVDHMFIVTYFLVDFSFCYFCQLDRVTFMMARSIGWSITITWMYEEMPCKVT